MYDWLAVMYPAVVLDRSSPPLQMSHTGGQQLLLPVLAHLELSQPAGGSDARVADRTADRSRNDGRIAVL